MAQVRCGYSHEGRLCAASICLEKMTAHYLLAHEYYGVSRPLYAKVLEGGSKLIDELAEIAFEKNDERWFDNCIWLPPLSFRTVIGGFFALELANSGPGELRFGVRQLGRGPPCHRLASVKVRFGPANGYCVHCPLSRTLAADERLRDDALCAGTPPAVGRINPAFLAPTLVLDTRVPRRDAPWILTASALLVFEELKDAAP